MLTKNVTNNEWNHWEPIDLFPLKPSPNYLLLFFCPSSISYMYDCYVLYVGIFMSGTSST